MSIEALQWAWSIEGLSPAQKAVLVSLANYADQDRTCYPSLRRLGVMTALSERTIRTALRELEARGYLTTESRATDGGRTTSNLYRFTVPGKEGARAAGGGGITRPPEGATAAPLEPKKEPTSSDEEVARTRASRLPADFAVSDTMRSWAETNAPDVDLRVATEAFIDYWRGVAGSKGTKLDWLGTWRNSMRSDQEAGRHRRKQEPGSAAPSWADRFGL